MAHAILAILVSAVVQGAPQEWTLETVLRIGSVDEPGTALSQVTGVSIGPNGAIYIQQPQEQHVKVFAPDGHPRTVLGRRGAGPGEFRDMSTISWRADSLFVTDVGLQRVLVFDTASRLLETRLWTPLPVNPPLSRRSVPLAVLANGTVLVRPNAGLGRTGPATMRGIPVLRGDWSGMILDTLAIFPYTPSVSIPQGSGFVVMAQPFPALPTVRVSPTGDRIVVLEFPEHAGVVGASVTVSLFDDGGMRLWVQTIRYPEKRIPNRVADSVYAAIGQSLSGSDVATRSAMRTARDHIRIPEVYPAVESVQLSDDGSVWLGLIEDAQGNRPWDILDRSGRRIATLKTPPRFSVRAIRNGFVWGVERDDLDVQYLVKCRIVRST